MIKHEFLDGDNRAMSGGTPKHSRLGAAVIIKIGAQLRVESPCQVYSADLPVRIGTLITYPDASVVCGDVQLDSEDPKAHLNPTLLVEVTSKSSERYDRGRKWQRYQLIPSLREYVIVSQREPAVDVFRRRDDGTWADAERFGPGQNAKLTSIGCELDVDRLYLIRGGN